MTKHISLIILVSIALLGCPSASNLQLAGDQRLVGTWEGNNILLGYHIFSRSTYDSEGNVTTFFRVQEDNSTATAGGKWYADAAQGFLDSVRVWTVPDNPDAEGVYRALYEVRGDTLEIWNNAVGMARPDSEIDAMTHTVSSRVTSKDADFDLEAMPMPGIAQQLISHL